jgi:hypothetical protein
MGRTWYLKFKMMKNNKQKSHKNLEMFSEMKKFVAFFQANSWLENSYKMLKI